MDNTNALHTVVESLDEMRIWLPGEDHHDDPQVYVKFRWVNKAYAPYFIFDLDEDIDADMLTCIIILTRVHATKLNTFARTLKEDTCETMPSI